MDQKPLLDIPGATYYVQLRSIEHRNLFYNRYDFKLFKQLLIQLADSTDSRLLVYCLIHDKSHLIIRSGASGIQSTCQWLISQYTALYNKHHQRQGNVFTQHYLCTLIEPQSYLLPIMHKVHWLPKYHHLVPEPGIYPWSSHNDYMHSPPPEWLDQDKVLNLLANRRAMRGRRYVNYIFSNPPDLTLESSNHLQYQALASRSFINKLIIAHSKTESDLPITLDQILDAVCKEYGVKKKELYFRRRHRLAGDVRILTAYLSQQLTGITINVVAEFLQMDPDLLLNGLNTLQQKQHPGFDILQHKISQNLIAGSTTVNHSVNQQLTAIGQFANTIDTSAVPQG